MTPDEIEQKILAAVKENGWAIKYIENHSDAVMSQHLIYYPDSGATPVEIECNAAAILNRHRSGLGEVYEKARTLGYGDYILRELLLAHVSAASNPYVKTVDGIGISA